MSVIELSEHMYDRTRAGLLSVAVDLLEVANCDLRDERDLYRSWWESYRLRLLNYQVRRTRFALAGAVGGALLVLILDGHVASYLDRLLNALGWTVS